MNLLIEDLLEPEYKKAILCKYVYQATSISMNFLSDRNGRIINFKLKSDFSVKTKKKSDIKFFSQNLLQSVLLSCRHPRTAL